MTHKININGVIRNMTEEDKTELQEHLTELATPESMEDKLKELITFMNRVKDTLSKLGINLDE